VHEDKELKNSDKYDQNKDIWAEIHMHRLYKTEDWYKDEKVLMKTIRKGKGRKPYADSTIYFRLRVEVDGKEVYTNFPKELSEIENDAFRPTKEDKFLEEFCDFKQMENEQREESLLDPTLLKARIDDYEMPSLLIKVLKSIQKN
jgi:hypothetical protein